MKMKKILNEWRKYSINEGRQTEAIYNLMRQRGIQIENGQLDKFMDVFTVDFPHEVSRWILDTYGEQIENEPDEVIRRKLYGGFTYNWRRLLGPEATMALVDKLTDTYYQRLAQEKALDMPAHLTKVPYEELSPAEKRNYKRIEKKLKAKAEGPSEKEWVKNNFDTLMDLISDSGARGDIEYTDIPAGFFGRMTDWWLGNSDEGRSMFEDSLRRNVLSKL